VINKNFKNPYVESWNLSLQRALAHNFSLDVAYVANHGVDQANNYDLNAATVLGQGINGQPEYVLFKRKSSTNFRYAGFNTAYHSLQVKVNRRFTNGLQIIGSYAYQKAEGYGGGDTGGIGGLSGAFYIDQRRNWQRLDFDQKESLAVGWVYELPFGAGKRWANSNAVSRAVLGSWQLNGNFSARTGTPMNFGGNSGVLNAPGNGNTLNYFGPGGIRILHGVGRDAPWFSPAICSATVTAQCFAQPANLQFGNLGHNVISGPGTWYVDLAVFRQFTISERVKVQLRGESFSVVNSPQWNNPDTNIGNKTFGFITSAGGNRSVQLGTKVIW
jgi:hypothetical protein